MRKRIVVVDDQVAILEIMRVALEVRGYQVETSQTGLYFQHMHPPFPDLILLDVCLGSEDGKTICCTLKSDEQTRHIPVILCSAYVNEAQTFRACGADDFLAKPFGLDALYTLIERHINVSATASRVFTP